MLVTKRDDLGKPYLDRDLLERGTFARELARVVSRWKGDESLVVGISGDWGTGKTFLKEMIREAIQAEPEHRLPVEFNPWEWAGQDRIARGLFEALLSALGDRKTKESREAARRLRRLAIRYGFLGEDPRILAAIVGLGVGAVGLFAGALLPGWLAGSIAAVILVTIVLVATSFTSWLLRFAFDSLATRLDELSIASDTPEDIKSKLHEAFQGLDAPVVVVLDDIDRLRPEEIRLLFQIVRANADLPNLVFLLLYSRRVVEAALKSDEVSGASYLEKIVHLPITLPTPLTRHVAAIFEGRLDYVARDIVEALGGDKPNLTRSRLSRFYHGPFEIYVPTVRAVERLLDSFNVHARLYVQDAVGQRRPDGSLRAYLAVEVVDLLLLETLRLYEPDLFDKLPSAKWHLTTPADLAHSLNVSSDVVKREVEKLMSVVVEPRRDAALGILSILFPRVSAAFGIHNDLAPAHEMFANHRVAHPEIFDRYFQRNISSEDVTAADGQLLLSILDDQEAMVAVLRDLLTEPRRLHAAFDVLTAEMGERAPDSWSPLLGALFDVGNELPQERDQSRGRPSLYERSLLIAQSTLEVERDATTRGRTLLDAIEGSVGVHLPADLVLRESRRQREAEDYNGKLQAAGRPPDRPLPYEPPDLETARGLLLERIRSRYRLPPQHGDHPLAFRTVMRAWRLWTTPGEMSEPRLYAAATASTPEGLLHLLNAFTYDDGEPAGDELVRAQLASGTTPDRVRSAYVHLSELDLYTPVHAIRDQLHAMRQDLEALEGGTARVADFNLALQHRAPPLRQGEKTLPRDDS